MSVVSSSCMRATYPQLAGIAVLALLAGCAAVKPQAGGKVGVAGIGAVSNVIIGGGMVHCSSMLPASSPQCSAPWPEILRKDRSFDGIGADQVLFGPVVPPAFQYKVTPAALSTLEALPERLLARADKQRVASILSVQMNTGPITAPQFQALLAGVDGQVLAAASEVFAERLLPATRRRQMRSVDFMSNLESAAIYRAVVAAAAKPGGRKPVIGLMTSSADNPYNDHDIYVSALRSAGAEVVWIPLEGGLRRALDAGDCEHLVIDYSAYAEIGTGRHFLHMDQVFPDLHALQRRACASAGATLNADLERIDGLFLTGGNQARHLDALVGKAGPSAQLQILRRRFAAGQLTVAGSSAGDAVQAGGLWRGRPVPMIAGGDSALALALGLQVAGAPSEESKERRASYYPGGGLGMFRFGPLDSHFSERGREGRLVRLVAESGMDYGFGVDENTALVVGRADAGGRTAMGVVGAGGVWVVDVRGARASGSKDGAFGIKGARVHYLHAGDRMAIDSEGKLEVMLGVPSAAIPAIPASKGAPAGANKFRLYALAGEMSASGAAEGNGVLEGPAGAAAFRLYRPAGSQMVRNARGRTSYVNMGMDIRTCGPRCESR